MVDALKRRKDGYFYPPHAAPLKEMEPAAPEVAKIKPAKAPKPKKAKAKKADKEATVSVETDETAKTEEPANKVVSLDAFRKK